ncbi:MAG: alpha/beta hydrolase family protein [Sporichthyaceae bacterium]
MSHHQGPDTGRVERMDIAGVPLAVRSGGDPADRPVVFWHPLGDVTSGAYLSELAPALTSRGLRLVAPDGPGFVASPPLPPEQYAVQRLAELVWGLVAALGLARPVLMGHSWGGVVMLAAAADRPDLLRQIQDDVRRPLTAAYIAGLEPAMRQTSTGAFEPVVTARTRAAAQHGMLLERSLLHWPTLATAEVPELLLLATEPRAGAPGQRGGRPRGALRADVHFLPGWGHDLVADGGPELAAIIGDWLSQRRP